MLMAVVATNAGTAICWAPSRIARFSGLPIARLRWMFSISTVASSTRMPTASASPPSVMMFSVWPRAQSATIATRIDSGMLIVTISVLRHEPRNSRISSPVSDAAISALDQHAVDRRLDEARLVVSSSIFIPSGMAAWIVGSSRVHLVGDVERGAVAVLQHRQQHAAPAVLADDLRLHGEAVVHLRDVADEDGLAVDAA